jgi:hypothetical protein
MSGVRADVVHAEDFAARVILSEFRVLVQLDVEFWIDDLLIEVIEMQAVLHNMLAANDIFVRGYYPAGGLDYFISWP